MKHPLLLAALAACSTAPPPAAVDLAAADVMSAFEFTDAAAWRRGDAAGRPCLELFGASHYQPKYRSPLSIALLDRRFGDGSIDVDLQSTCREYAHRDLIVVFAWRDADHFAYAHLASQGDANAHHLMLVDGADRRPVTTSRTAGVTWGDGWHHLRLTRRGSHVEVFFDAGAQPVLVGEVPVDVGRIGLGSFDDTGRFADLTVRDGSAH
jgi:hypothetical protein